MSPVALGPLRDMLGYALLALAAALGLATLLACCRAPKKVSPPEEDPPQDNQDPPYSLRTRPTVPAVDLSIYHRY